MKESAQLVIESVSEQFGQGWTNQTKLSLALDFIDASVMAPDLFRFFLMQYVDVDDSPPACEGCAVEDLDFPPEVVGNTVEGRCIYLCQNCFRRFTWPPYEELEASEDE